MNRKVKICLLIFVCILLVCAAAAWIRTNSSRNISEDAVLVYMYETEEQKINAA